MDEGDRCQHFGPDCCGRMVIVLDGACSCHIAPPCPACEGAFLECDDCGWSPRDDETK